MQLATSALSTVGGPDPAVHCRQISLPFAGSNAARVDGSVRGDVVDLSARGADIHQFPVAQIEQGGAEFLAFAALPKENPICPDQAGDMPGRYGPSPEPCGAVRRAHRGAPCYGVSCLVLASPCCHHGVSNVTAATRLSHDLFTAHWPGRATARDRRANAARSPASRSARAPHR